MSFVVGEVGTLPESTKNIASHINNELQRLATRVGQRNVLCYSVCDVAFLIAEYSASGLI